MKISEDGKSICIKDLKEMYSGIKTMEEFLENNILEDAFKNTILSLSEMMISNISKNLNYQGEIANRINERSAKSKEINNKIQELEEQLLKKSSFDGFGDRISNICDIVYKFWKTEGLGNIFERRIINNGIFYGEFTLSPDLDEPIDDEEVNPKRKTKEDFSNFDLCINEGYLLADTPRNRKNIEKIIQDRFPSADILEFVSRRQYGEDALRQVNIYIHNILDITNRKEQ